MRLSVFVILMVAVIGVVVGQPHRAAADRLVVPDSGLFRTVIDVAGEFDLGRAQATGATLIDETAGSDGIRVTLLADGDQLEALARLGFLPLEVDDLGAIATGLHETRSTYASTLSGEIYSSDSTADLLSVVTKDTQALAAASSLDDDADGLTNTQESWWCTNPLGADTDSDGVSDGNEVAAIKRWLRNTDVRPTTGKPFLGWPSGAVAPCIDADYDSVPDLAERWDLGLNQNLESTDLDRYDDGQELFGVTNCPGGGGACGYGLLPHVQDGSLVGSNMPSFVKAPGNHPLAAGYPLPEIDVVPSSLKVLPVTTITSGTTTVSSTERTYSTAKTEGTSSSIANTKSWNDWQEVSESKTSPASALSMEDVTILSASSSCNGIFTCPQTQKIERKGRHKDAYDAAVSACRTASANVGISGGLAWIVSLGASGGGSTSIDSAFTSAKCSTAIRKSCGQSTEFAEEFAAECNKKVSPDPVQYNIDNRTATTINNTFDTENISSAIDSLRLSFDSSSNVLGQRLFDISAAILTPTITDTTTSGHSYGEAQTITNTQYEEHTVTNGENILNGSEWENATAVNSAAAAELRFTYRLRNNGTDYARSVSNVLFNIYLGDDEIPAASYAPSTDLLGTGTVVNFPPCPMPGCEINVTSSRPIVLSLDQLRRIDLGAPIRIVVEDFTFAADELYYNDAIQAGVTVAIEDGTDDGDEIIDRYIMPIIAAGGHNETVYAILARFFPNTVDANGQLTAIWTPENRQDTPAWCDQPKPVGSGSTRVLWCRHALSTADWWNIYTNGLGTGSEPLEDTQASPGSIALFRFNSDSDLDGYSDRSEAQFGTNPNDASSHPNPNLVAGVNNIPALPANNTLAPNTVVTSTLSLLNLGVYDAYGVEAVMISPDSTTSILNNTVGGSGRVKAQKQVIVGSRVALPPTLPGNWGNTGHAKPVAGGYFTGSSNRTYTFTTVCGGTCTVGQGSWTLNWNNGAGLNGSLQMGATYKSPTLLDTGEGVKVALITGTVSNGETFTISATTPADTFQFKVNSSPFTPPLVIVSYNDPQGNHRFVVPPSAMRLSTPSDNLASLGVPVSQMLPDPGVEIVTTAVATLPGANTSNTKLLVNNPTGTTLTNAKLFLNFINEDGTVVKEYTSTIATLLPGPTYVPMSWNTADFSPAFNGAQDYIVLAFLTDYDGNIIDTGGRPLSSWQIDPVAQAAAGALSWNFGTAPQGVLLQHQFALGSTGQRELLAYLNVAAATGSTCGLGVSGDPATILAPGDVAYYNVTIDTSGCPNGAFSTTIPIRTSDQSTPTQNLTVSGTFGGSSLRDVTPAAIHPLDYAAVINGPKNAGEWVEFTHGIGADPGTIEPVKVYDSTYSLLKGVGEAATDFGTDASSSAAMFGDGRDGPLVVTTSSAFFPIDSIAAGTLGSTTLQATNPAFSTGQQLLIHQTQGAGAGTWMRNGIASYAPGTIMLTAPLNATYSSGAQVLVLPQYTDVTIQGSATYYPRPWYGSPGSSTGGILAFLASGTVTVNGIMTSTGSGFSGGVGRAGANGGGVYQQQGEGESGIGTYANAPNGTGGGGGNSDNGNRTSGGGGGGNRVGGAAGQSTGGGPPPAVGGSGGSAGSTTPDLSRAVFGSGGGAGGALDGWTGTGGGAGGGIVFVSGRSVTGSGLISSDGGPGASGRPVDVGYASSGGGGGGAIILRAGTAALGTLGVSASGAVGGPPIHGLTGGGGQGGDGAIRVEYCDSITGTSTPVASTQKLNCYIAEQKDGAPTTTRLNLPAAIPPATSTTYNVQYGRKATFASAGNVDTTIPVPAGIWDGATIDALISGTPAGAPSLTIDIGNDGPVNNVTIPFTGGAPITLSQIDLKAAINAYYQAHGGAGTSNVPVRISLSSAGTVLLTNLEMFPTASILSKIRIPAGTYSDAKLNLQVGDSGAGPLDISVDVGDNGTTDWSTAGTYTYPAPITTGNVATGPGGAAGGLNTYLTGKTGDVDVPVRIAATPSLSRKITGFTATLSPLPDLDLGTVSFGQPNPTEGDTISVSVPITNTGSTAGGTSVTFFGISPVFGRIYLGSSFLASVGTTGNASIQWKTLGFTGSTAVEAMIDYYGDVQESNENNNSSTGSIAIATRPDLKLEPIPPATSAVTLSIPEPVTQDSVTVSITVKNAGQAAAGASVVSFYDGDPSTGGPLIGTANLGALAAGASTAASIPWTTPAVPGAHLLVARVDSGAQVNEGDEGNNDLVLPVRVGFRGPITINSGAGVVADPAYDATRGWGFAALGDADLDLSCGAGDDPSIRYDPTGDASGGVGYQFDHLQPGRFYHLDVVMHECISNIGRVQAVEVNGVDIAVGENLADGQPHRLSLLLDPASYAGGSIAVRVHETSGLGAGAILNSIALHDIDYRYADSGASAATDPSYASSAGTKRYGHVIGGSQVTAWGILPSQTGRQNSLANAISYRFDGLSPAKSYKINGTFYHGTTQARTLQFQVDGVAQGSPFAVPNSTKTLQTVVVPSSAYSGDSSIEVTIVRTDASVLPVISEISLEEVTQGVSAPVPVCYALTTTESPASSGSVTRNVQPSCEGNTKYPASTPVQLTAVPSNDYVFDSWSGGLGTLSPITVTMDANKSVTANFARCYSLVATAGANGTVQVQTPATPGCPSGEFKAGTVVSVLATPNANYSFSGWTGDAVTAQNPLQIVMSADRSVTANFQSGVTCFGLTAGAAAGGTVGVQPPPDCPTDSSKYASSTSVTLTATPNPGFSFTGWTGSTQSGVNPLTFVMSSARNYTAQFAQCYSLSTSVSGNGTVSPSPAPNCDSNTKYVSGTQVQLSATASANNVFDSWSGDAQGSTAPTVVTMSSNKSVAANFLQCFSLATAVSSAASGSVSIQTASNCPGGKFKAGTNVSVLAVAANGFFFQSWSGDANGGTNPTSVVMNGDRSVTAQFSAEPPCYSLSVSAGTGGTAAAQPGPNCAGEYDAGTAIQLTASPNPGFVFKEWTGSTTSQSNPLDIVMDGDKSYAASFVRCYDIAVSGSPGGSGSVDRSPSPNCPANNGKYVEGTTVTLTPQPASGWSFLNWSGGSASGGANPLAVIANADKTIVANFTAAGDTIEHPVTMTSHSFSFDFDAANANKEAGDPVLVSGQECGFSERLEHSVWMSFTSPRRGTLWVSTAGSGFDTVIAIFSDSPSGANQVGCNDNTPGETTSFLSVTTLPGTTYWIEFGSWLPGSVGMLEVQSDWFGSTDINCSHGTDALDALELLRILAGLLSPLPGCSPDADGNAATELGDAIYVRLWIAGLVPGSDESLLAHSSIVVPTPGNAPDGLLRRATRRVTDALRELGR